MLGKTQTSLRQSPEFQTRMKGVWLGCCGQWCQKRQTDQGGKDMTTQTDTKYRQLFKNTNIKPKYWRRAAEETAARCSMVRNVCRTTYVAYLYIRTETAVAPCQRDW